MIKNCLTYKKVQVLLYKKNEWEVARDFTIKYDSMPSFWLKHSFLKTLKPI